MIGSKTRTADDDDKSTFALIRGWLSDRLARHLFGYGRLRPFRDVDVDSLERALRYTDLTDRFDSTYVNGAPDSGEGDDDVLLRTGELPDDELRRRIGLATTDMQTGMVIRLATSTFYEALASLEDLVPEENGIFGILSGDHTSDAIQKTINLYGRLTSLVSEGHLTVHDSIDSVARASGLVKRIVDSLSGTFESYTKQIEQNVHSKNPEDIVEPGLLLDSVGDSFVYLEGIQESVQPIAKYLGERQALSDQSDENVVTVNYEHLRDPDVITDSLLLDTRQEISQHAVSFLKLYVDKVVQNQEGSVSTVEQMEIEGIDGITQIHERVASIQTKLNEATSYLDKAQGIGLDVSGLYGGICGLKERLENVSYSPNTLSQ